MPAGLRVVLDGRVRRAPDGVLTGGSPRRAMRLSAAGRRALRDLERGDQTDAAVLRLARRLVDDGLAHPRPELSRTAGDVTVVIPTHGRRAQLDRCLAALDPGQPVLVVDDGSPEPSAIAAVARRHGAEVLRRSRRTGPAAARNAALALVSSDLVAFLDSDTVAPRNWLRALVGHFDDPTVAAVAPRIRPLRSSPGSLLARYAAARSPLDLGARDAAVIPGRAVPYVPTAALIVRRRAAESGFDPDLRYGEDVDLVWRLHDAGWRIRYDTSVTVAHDEPASLGRLLARRWSYGTAAAPLARRHPGRLAPAVLSPQHAFALGLALAGHRRAAAVLAGQQAALLADRLRPLGIPRRTAAAWTAQPMLESGRSLARYAVTIGAPAAALAALRWHRPVAALLAAGLLDDCWRRGAGIDPLRWTALALADDLAYAAGVWSGCVRHRTIKPLLPRLALRDPADRRR